MATSDEKPIWDVPINLSDRAKSRAGDLAAKHKISHDRAQMLVDRFGDDEKGLEAAAESIGPGKSR
jgi:hypothetical protein